MAIFSRRIWRAREMSLPIMAGAARSVRPGKLIKLRHGQTHYQLDDEADRPLLICIHGWSTSSYVWEQLRPSLRDRGYRLLTYDLYGRGLSDRPDLRQTPKFFTQQLDELLSRLNLRNQRMNVLGYSMGGAIAAHFVSQNVDAVDRMLLLAPAGMIVRFPITRRVARSFPKVFDPHLLAALPKVLPSQFDNEAQGFAHLPEVARVVQSQKRELAYRGYIPSLVSSLNGVLAANMKAEHRKIVRSGLRVRAVFGAEDTTIPSPWAKRLFDHWYPTGTSVEIRGAGHGLPYTHPGNVAEQLGDALIHDVG